MTAEHQFIEVQGTGEGGVFGRQTMDALISLAQQGIDELLSMQKKYV
jgi:ribonuclease PH